MSDLSSSVNGLNVISRGMKGKEVVGKTRLGRRYARSLAGRDRKSDPVRGLLFAVPRGEKDIRSKPIKSRTSVFLSCLGGNQSFTVLTRGKINKCSCKIRVNDTSGKKRMSFKNTSSLMERVNSASLQQLYNCNNRCARILYPFNILRRIKAEFYDIIFNLCEFQRFVSSSILIFILLLFTFFLRFKFNNTFFIFFLTRFFQLLLPERGFFFFLINKFGRRIFAKFANLKCNVGSLHTGVSKVGDISYQCSVYN